MQVACNPHLGLALPKRIVIARLGPAETFEDAKGPRQGKGFHATVVGPLGRASKPRDRLAGGRNEARWKIDVGVGLIEPMRFDAVTGGGYGGLETRLGEKAALDLNGGGNRTHKAVPQLRIGRRRLAPEAVEGTLKA